MNSVQEFAELVSTELGVAVTAEDIGRRFDDLPGWDSVNMLRLIVVMERVTGRSFSLPSFLEADSLARIYDLAVAG